MKVQRIDHTGINGQDLETAIAFLPEPWVRGAG